MPDPQDEPNQKVVRPGMDSCQPLHCVNHQDRKCLKSRSRFILDPVLVFDEIKTYIDWLTGGVDILKRQSMCALAGMMHGTSESQARVCWIYVAGRSRGSGTGALPSLSLS